MGNGVRTHKTIAIISDIGSDIHLAIEKLLVWRDPYPLLREYKTEDRV